MGILNPQQGEICRAVYVGRGSVASPSISFESRPNTGIFLQGDEQIAFSIAGVEVLVLGADGLLFDDGTLAAPSISFDADTDTGFYRIGANTLGTAAAQFIMGGVTAGGDTTSLVVMGDTAAGATAVPLGFIHDSASPADGDEQQVRFYSTVEDAGNAAVELCRISITQEDATAATDDATFRLDIMSANTLFNDALIVGSPGATAAYQAIWNEDGDDMDHRMEGDNNANLFVLDAGLDSLSHGAAVTAGAFLTLSPYAQSRAHVTSVGAGTHVPAGTLTDSGNASLAIGAANFLGTPTWGGTGTYTDSANLYIADAPTAGTKTLTRNYAVLVDAGQVRCDGRLIAGGRVSEVMTITDLDAQSGDMLAAAILGGIFIHTTVTGGGTVTTDTAANIISGIPLQQNGECIVVHYINDGTQTATFAGGTDVTFSDVGNTVLTNESAIVLFRRTTATTCTAHIIN